MGYVPKGKQKKLNAQAQMRAHSATTLELMKIQTSQRVLKEAGGVLPRRLELGVTPQHVCRAYDVYFNGERQQLCTVADVDKGYIVRYVKGLGNMPLSSFGVKSGNVDTERLFGKVQIVAKGTKPTEDYIK